MSCWNEWIAGTVQQLEDKSLLRRLRPTAPGDNAVEVDISSDELDAWVSDQPSPSEASIPDGGGTQPSQVQRLRLFSLNDYMALSTHPEVRQAAAKAAEEAGMGPRSSALVGGYTTHHQRLEQAIAQLKHTEACLLFPTGFAANVATTAALCANPHTAIFSDELNHASIIDGCRLAIRAGAKLFVYRHNDMAHLGQLLDACHKGLRKYVVTDSLFSMDGDFADLPGLVALRRVHGFMLAIDEAHATLVCGARGGGAAEMMGVEEHVDVHIGTLSKGFGALGGFVACSRRLRQLLMNRGRSYMFSTALPVPVVAAAHAALEVSLKDPSLRANLWARVRQLGDALGVLAESPIIPLIIGSEADAVQAANALLARGFHVPAIRPPTVPAGTSRLRVSLSAAHTAKDINDLVAVLKECNVKILAPPGARSRL